MADTGGGTRISLAKQALERRPAQLERVEWPSLAGVDPKTAKALIRLYRKELRDRKYAGQLELAKEVGLGSVAALIYSIGNVTKAGIDALGNIGKGLAENPDPVAQAVAIGGAYALFAWWVSVNPKLAKSLGLDRLAINTPAGQKAVKDVIDTVNRNTPSTIPIQGGQGKYGLEIKPISDFFFLFTGVPTVAGTYWFDTVQQRSDFRKLMNDKLGIG